MKLPFALRLRPQDWTTDRTVAPAAFAFLVFAATGMLRTAANAQVLARFPVMALPYLYVGSALLTVLVCGLVAFFRFKQGGWGPTRAAFVGAGLAWLLGGAVLWGQAPAALGSYLFVESFSTLLMLSFWAHVGRLFPEAKETSRAFARLGAVAMLGATAGGLCAAGIAKVLGTGLLPFLGAPLLVMAGALLRAPLPPTSTRQLERAHLAPRPSVTKYLAAEPVARSLVLFVLVLSTVTTFADFLFRMRAQALLSGGAAVAGVVAQPVEDGLTVLFASVHIGVGLFAWAFQWLCARWLLHKRGRLQFVVLVPAVVLGLAVAALFTQDLWPVYALKAMESALSLAVLPVAAGLLYTPVPTFARNRLRNAMEGFVRKGGVVLAGGLLLALVTLRADSVLPVTVAALAFLSGLLFFWMRPARILPLQDRISRSVRDELTLTPRDENLLANALATGEPERALRALTWMQTAKVSPRPHLEALLAHDDERVIERGLQLTVELGAKETVALVERLMDEGPRKSRPEAAWTLANLSPDRARARLPSLLENPDPALRCSAMGALMMLEPNGDAAPVLEAMTRAGNRAPAAERREVAKLLGRLRDETHADSLAQYLEDGDAEVRHTAIIAAGQGRYTSLAPRLLAYLTWPEERRAAREALVAMGNSIVPLLDRTLNDRTRSEELRGELPRVLRLLGTQSALDVLLFSNLRDEAFLHKRTAVALSRMREEVPHLSAEESWVVEAMGRRLDVYRRLVEAYPDLIAALGRGAMLTRAVKDRLEATLEISFLLLGLIYPPKEMRRIYGHLVGRDVGRRTAALSLLESVVQPQHRELLSEQIAGLMAPAAVGSSDRLSWHLATLCHSADGVVRGIARQTATRYGHWNQPRGEDEMNDEWVQRLFALEGVEMFAQCDVDDLAAVAGLAREETFRKGERIYDVGDPGEALYIIRQGRVLADLHGQEVLVFSEREAFGEVSLLDGSPRPTGARAIEDCTVLVIDRSDFLDLIADRPQLLRSVFRSAMRQYSHVIQFPRRGPALETTSPSVEAMTGEASASGTQPGTPHEDATRPAELSPPRRQTLEIAKQKGMN